MLPAPSPSVSSHPTPSPPSRPLLLGPRFPTSHHLWLRIPAAPAAPAAAAAANDTAYANRNANGGRQACVKVSARLHSSARARELMRLNQQREPRPEPFRPPGIPSSVPVSITNILPINLPSHPNAPMPAYVLVPSAAGDANTIGDCPFSQKVLMTLEEKYLPYEGWFIDAQNKPIWLSELNTGGKIPVMLVDGNWVGDADLITEILEKKLPLPAMRTPPEKAAIGAKIFPLFVKFLRSKESNSDAEQTLLVELKALNEHLKNEAAAHKNPFVCGRFPTMLDMDLAPKLYHMDVALKHFKNWFLPEDLIYLDAYMKKIFARPSFTRTKCREDVLIGGWESHLSIMGQ